MYKNINTDRVVKYFFVCVIFRIISRTNRGQIIEKWAFSEYKYQFFSSISMRIICMLLFFGIGLLVFIFQYHDFHFVSYSRSNLRSKKDPKVEKWALF